MKGKILIVLFSLVLAFGMVVVSCDNGDFPKDPNKDANGASIPNNHSSALEFDGLSDGAFDPPFSY